MYAAAVSVSLPVLPVRGGGAGGVDSDKIKYIIEIYAAAALLVKA